MSDRTVTCKVCGKSFEADDTALGNWMLKNPDKVRCDECAKAGKKIAGGNTTTSAKKTPSGATGKVMDNNKTFTKPKGEPITPKAYHKMLDEFRAEFGDDFEVIKDFLGPMMTTCLLDAKK